MRSALEAALAVAQELPSADVPRPLGPLLRFRRLPASAYSTVYRVLSDDPSFRAVVADASDLEVDSPGWLFLVRPEGWELALEGHVAAASADVAAAAVEQDEREAARRARAAEDALREARGEIGDLRRELTKAQAELGRERRARREAVAALRDTPPASARPPAPPAPVPPPPAPPPEPPAPPTPPVPVPSPPDVRPLLAALGQLRSAVDGVEEAVRAVAAGPSARAPRRPRPPRAPRRQPVALPPATYEESPEAAEHLVRVAGVLLVVDGYNASLSAWGALPIVEQRDRLVSALEELAARTGARAHVVFDGVDAGAGREQRVRGRCVVTFSPDEVEADDVIIEMVESTPAGTPVVVATDDRRVRDAAAAAGANLLTREQLFGVLRRER